jgi:hypothetical protein
MVIKHFGRIKSGKFLPNNAELFKKEFIKREGKKVYVVVKTETKARSTQQNKYLWAIYNMLSEHTGNQADDLHEYFKAEFLKEPLGGAIAYRIKSTTELTTIEFTKFIEEIKRFSASELQFFLPEPEVIDGL